MATKKQQSKGLLRHFHFSDMTEYLIFMVWALFVTAFLLTVVN